MFKKDLALNEANSIAEYIAKKYYPNEIYLFGSLAYGNPNEGSDIDICLVMDSGEKRDIEILQDVRSYLFDKTTYPVDFVLYRPTDFNKYKNNLSTLQGIIASKGVCLYDRNNN